jgi:hypothetical protein
MGPRIPNAEVVGLPAGYFDVYTSEKFKRVVEKQADFWSNILIDMRRLICPASRISGTR